MGTELIFSRVIGLQASAREIDMKEVFAHELSNVPTLMFTEFGEMRMANKSLLKQQLQVAVSNRHAETNSTLIIDGSALLWVIKWPVRGTVEDFIKNLVLFIEKKLAKQDIYLIFDRYFDFSPKSGTRQARANDISRVYQLSLNSQLPSQKVVLSVVENKRQLIRIICSELLKDTRFHQKHTINHKLVITSEDRIPTQVSNGGLITLRDDLETSHKEADLIIVQQMLVIAREGPGGTGRWNNSSG